MAEIGRFRKAAADLRRGVDETIVLRPDPEASNGNAIELYVEFGVILSLYSEPLAPNAKGPALAGPLAVL